MVSRSRRKCRSESLVQGHRCSSLFCLRGYLMNRNSLTPVSLFQFWVLVVSIALSIAIFSHTVHAQTVNFQPRDRGSVDDSRGTASRSTVAKCQSDETWETGLTPVVPSSDPGFTLATQPTFYVYIPPTSATNVQFTLKNESDHGIYQTTIPLNETAGIITIPLPNSVSLDIGKTYHWFVGLGCHPVQTDFPWAQGSVQRMAPEDVSAIAIEQKTLLEQAAMYGREGLWYDTLNSLAQHVQTQPDDATARQNWVNLLNAVGLGAIADQPFIPSSAVPE
jgi:Domain of Unknown Function (DUF928)